MSETLLTVVGAIVLIGGPFFLFWMLDRKRQAKEGQPAMPAGHRLLRLLGILAIGVVVIVGVFYSCTWVMATQPTVGNLNLTTVIGAVVIVGGFIVVTMKYAGLLGGIMSFISGKREEEARTDEEVMEAPGPAEEAAQHLERAEEPSVAIEVEAFQKRKWIVFGNLAIVLAWAAGVYVGTYLGTGSFSWLPENLPRIVDAAATGMRYGFCCTLPVLAFGLLLLWMVGRGFIAGKLRRTNLMAAMIAGAVIAAVGGCLFGWFAVIEWYH